jgi:hypothetical protein
MFLDLRNIGAGSVATDWILGRHPMRTITAAYDDTKPDYFYMEVSLPTLFDAVVYVQDSTPSLLIP